MCKGAVAPSWLALLPPNVDGPKGGYVWYEKQIVDWVNCEKKLKKKVLVCSFITDLIVDLPGKWTNSLFVLKSDGSAREPSSRKTEPAQSEK